MIQAIVVGKRDVEGVLPRSEAAGKVSEAGFWVGIIESTVVFLPIYVPRRLVVRRGIVLGWALAYPENRRCNRFFPRICRGFLELKGVLGGRHYGDFRTFLPEKREGQ